MLHFSRFTAVWVIAVALTAACTRTAPPDEAAPAGADAAADVPWTATVEPLATPAEGQSGYQQLTTSPRGAILSWLEDGGKAFTLKFAEQTADGWSPARTVASSDNWFVSAADPSTVMRMADGTLVATLYPAVDPSIEAYDLRLVYSRDEGKTWSRPIAPHHDTTMTQHGFATLFDMPEGALGLVWLDGRAGESMSLYFGSFDRAWKQTAEAAVDDRACECCQTTVAVTDDGPLVAFRDRSPREIRDIHTSLLTGGAWTQPRPVHVDNWRIEACPVNGPALSARGRQVAAAWFTVQDEQAQTYAAFSEDSGRTWGAPIRLDDGTAQGHVDVELLEDGSAVASWVEYANQRGQIRVRRVTRSGERSASLTVLDGSAGRVSGYPRLARLGGDLMVAWTESAGGESGGQSVKAARVRLQ